MNEFDDEHLEDLPHKNGLLNIVYHVSGSIVRPEHQGLRTGSFFRKKGILMIQVAVPDDVATGQVDSFQFMWNTLREAVRMAVPIFEKANIQFSLMENLSLIDAAKRKIANECSGL